MAKALQVALPFPAMLFEAEAVFPVAPHDHPRSRDGTDTHPRVVQTFHRSVATWADAGFHVILDGSLPYEDRPLRDSCIRMFAVYDLYLIGVTCDLVVLNGRERERPERRPEGWTAHQVQDIQDRMDYAAVVDTSTAPPEECGRRIVEQLGW